MNFGIYSLPYKEYKLVIKNFITPLLLMVMKYQIVFLEHWLLLN